MEKEGGLLDMTPPGTSEKSAWGLGLCFKPSREVTGKKSQRHVIKGLSPKPTETKPTGSETDYLKNQGKSSKASRVA